MSGRDARAWGGHRTSSPSTVVALDDVIVMSAEPDVVWRYLQDIEAVSACIPGLLPGSVEQVDQNTFRGSLRHVAMGVPSLWELEARVDRSESDRSLGIHLDGREGRLNLTLAGEARLSVDSGSESGATLAYTGELTVTGRLAGAGGPIIERVVGGIIGRFVERVGKAGAAPTPSPWKRFVSWLKALLHRLDHSDERA